MEDDQELLDLVNDKDEVIGTVLRAEYYNSPDRYEGYLRSVEVFLVNDEGKLWVPRRTMDKKIAPGGFDYSCGGHVTAGESYIISGLREIEEELNLRLSEENLQFVKKFYPTSEIPYMREMYKHKTNNVPQYNTDDFCEYEWLTPEELITRLEAGEPAKSSLLSTVYQVVDLL